jgi:hypothetical protein
MSPRYSQSAGDPRPADGQPAEEDGRPFTTGIGSMVGPADDETAPPPPPAVAPPPPGPPQPTFTARRGEGPAGEVPEPARAPDDAVEADNTRPDTPAIGPDDGAAAETAAAPAGDAVPGAGPAVAAGPAPGDDLTGADGDRARAHPLPTTASLDEPRLNDADGLRTRWQRVQAGFVDDPREAVGEAADLIELTAQAMVGALRQRQRQLRVMWESGPASEPGGSGSGESGSGESAAPGQDTEHLRQMMRHYRALFNQLCRS